MSSVITSTPQRTRTGDLRLHSATPSFWGIMRGEFFKVRNQRATWIMAILLLGVIVLPYIISVSVPRFGNDINIGAVRYITQRAEALLTVFRAFSGIFLIILTARMIGLEYQLGTIRILLARGVGRVQLLSAKLLTMAIIAVVMLIIGLALNLIFMGFLVLVGTGSLNALTGMPSSFWYDMWLFTLTILLNMGVTILMAATMAVLGRSQVFGLSAGLAFFPADNLIPTFFFIANRITGNDFWLNATAYFLGPNLNVMPTVLIPNVSIALGATPFVQVDFTHTLLVALVYAAIFALASFILTWRRDVKE